MDDTHLLKIAWEREMESRKERLLLLGGMRPMDEEAIEKYELNQLSFDDWCSKYVEDQTKSDAEFDSNAMDDALYKDDLDWSFEKPKHGEYSTIYIFKKEDYCDGCKISSTDCKEKFKEEFDDPDLTSYRHSKTGWGTFCPDCIYDDSPDREDDD